MNFVDAIGRDGTRINLDLVAEIRPHGPLLECFNSTGEKLGTIRSFSLTDHPVTVVPNHSDTQLIGFFDNDPPDGGFETYPILAWIIDHGSATPVICESLPNVWCFLLPGGSYLFPEDATCQDLDDAQAHAIEELIRNNEERAKKAPPEEKPS